MYVYIHIIVRMSHIEMLALIQCISQICDPDYIYIREQTAGYLYAT